MFFSYSLTRNGRGFSGIDCRFSALIPFPKEENDFIYYFIQLLHEYTHAFTDSLLEMNINMKDGSHYISENVVIVTDYYLIKAIDENIIYRYLEMFTNDKNTTEKEFLNKYSIDIKLEEKIKEIIRNIIKNN